MKTARWASSAVLVGALALGSTGCIKRMLVDGQIEGTRRASAAIDTMSDYEIANVVAFDGLGQFEGMHYLAPDNEDALFMLAKSWSGATYAFIEDQMEQAEDAEGPDGALYQYQQARARAGYERAIHYGVELLEMKNSNFEAAKKNHATMKKWLAAFTDPERDAPALFWTAYAWMARANVLKEEPAAVADLFIGVDMMERSVELDETYLFGSGHIALGAYHARSPMAEMEDGKKHFDRAIQISGGKMLMAEFNLAATYYCTKVDKMNYEKALNDVLAAGDVFPEQRLTNTIAKRRAKRYLSKTRERACGF